MHEGMAWFVVSSWHSIFLTALMIFFATPPQIVAVAQKKRTWKSCMGVADGIFTLLASAGL